MALPALHGACCVCLYRYRICQNFATRNMASYMADRAFLRHRSLCGAFGYRCGQQETFCCWSPCYFIRPGPYDTPHWGYNLRNPVSVVVIAHCGLAYALAAALAQVAQNPLVAYSLAGRCRSLADRW